MKANHKRKLNSKMLLFLNKLTTASKFNNKKRKEVGRSLNNEQRIQCVLRKIDSLLYLNTFLFLSSHSAIHVKLEEEKSFINLIESSRGL